jgi:hypothetical protein
MKVYILYFIVITLLFSLSVNAQTNRKNSTQSNQARGASQTTQTNTHSQKPVTMSQATDSLKFAVTDFKKSMHSLFGGKKDTIEIFISDVEYDDANLSILKESLRKIKGGKFVNMQYKSSNAILEVSFKGSSTDLWDQIPSDSKKLLKLLRQMIII